MKITADTNVLIRAAVGDDPKQAAAATKLLASASVVAVALSSLCEFVWVLDSVYKFGSADIQLALEALSASENVALDRPALDAGLAVLKAGGDFADGVIAHEGKWLGGETFVSFDKRAVSLIARQGHQTKLLT
jgi:predicted nucleic-acid-binding protein